MPIPKDEFEKAKTPEAMEKMKKFLDEVEEKEKLNDKKAKELVSNNKYFLWLKEFTLKYEGFTDETFLYEKLPDNDRNYVDELHLFYRGISNYALENYIYPTPCDFGGFFKIKLNDTGFEIGELCGQGTLFFCHRVPVKEDFIDFNDIINNKRKNSIIKMQLEQFSDYIISLHENGVPIEALANTFKNTIFQINYEAKLNEKEKTDSSLKKKI